MPDEKTLLVSLDLDETLYYRADALDQVGYRDPDAVLPGGLAPYLYLRPHAATLLRYLGEHPHRAFGFYTASCGDGTDAAVAYLETLAGSNAAFFFDAQRVTRRYRDSGGPYGYGPSLEQVKDLKKVKRHTGFGFDDIFAVDDKPVYPHQYGNAFYVDEYIPITAETDETDVALLSLHQLLSSYRHTDSVRTHFAGQPRHFKIKEKELV